MARVKRHQNHLNESTCTGHAQAERPARHTMEAQKIPRYTSGSCKACSSRGIQILPGWACQSGGNGEMFEHHQSMRLRSSCARGTRGAFVHSAAACIDGGHQPAPLNLAMHSPSTAHSGDTLGAFCGQGRYQQQRQAHPHQPPQAQHVGAFGCACNSLRSPGM